MKRILISALLLLMSGAAFAQNLNPTVEVTNTYAREATGIEKPSQLLQMPDSVLKFNLDMDYSVRSTPYQGAYEFKPYLVQLRPMPRPSQEGYLYLRAGAGYSLHPEVTAVWTPVNTGRFRMNVYADHVSYIGQYHNIGLQDGAYLADGTFRSGKNLRTAAGTDVLYTWNGGQFMANLQYRNVLATDLSQADFSHNRGVFQALVKSAPGTRLSYELGTRISLGGFGGFREWHTDTQGSLGTRLGVNFFRLGLFAETVSQPAGYAANIGLVPHYMLEVNDFKLDLGVRLSMILHSDDFCPYRSGFIFPDVHVSYDLMPDVVVLQAAATGRDKIVSYEELLSKNPFVAGFAFHTDNMVERINLMAGLRGNLLGKLHYDLKAGYKHIDNAWSWGEQSGTAIPYMNYVSPLRTFYVSLEAGWKSDRLDVGAFVYYGHTPMPDLTGNEGLFAPASFHASGHVFYNWGGRIRAGVAADGRSAMRSKLGSVPGYTDLSLQGEFQMTRSLGFWLKAGNLLSQRIQRVPFYAEKGLYFTVGATWNL